MICSKCGNKISNDSKFCYRCGNKTGSTEYDELNSETVDVTTTEKNCSKCGNKLSGDALFCYKCGNKTDGVQSDELDDYTTENSVVEYDKLDSYTTENSSDEYAETDEYSNESSDNYSTPNDNISELQNDPTQNTEQQNYNATNVNPPLKTTKNGVNNKIILIGGVLIFIIAIVALVTPNTDTSTDTETLIETSEEVPTETIDNTNNDEIQLTQNYTDEEEGFSFSYPADWTEDVDSANESDSLVWFEAPAELDYRASMFVSKINLNMNGFSIYNLQDYIIEGFGEDGIEVNGLIDTQISGVDAIKIDTNLEDGTVLVVYTYTLNGDIYSVSFFSHPDNFDKYEPIFDSIMESYKITYQIGSASEDNDFYEGIYKEMLGFSENSKEILFGETNISKYLGSDTDSIYDDFGDPKAGTPVDGSLYDGYGYIDYDGIRFFYDNTLLIFCISGNPKMFTYEGVTLDKNRDEIVELLGVPSFENSSYSNNFENYVHWLEYSKDDYIVRIDFEGQGGNAYQISFINN